MSCSRRQKGSKAAARRNKAGEIISERSSITLHKTIHRAAHSGDKQTVAEMIAGDVTWHIPGRSLISGDFHGREAVMNCYFGHTAELSGGSAGFEDFQAYFASDDYSAALFRRTATRSGKTIV